MADNIDEAFAGWVARLTQLIEAQREVMRQDPLRAVGYDGPDDVRVPQELGPAGGSLEAVQADLQLEANQAREYDEANPSLLDRVESLEQRAEALTQAPRDQERQQAQGMEY